ncbi:LysR family transcriptional regulator [Verrucomicrobiales bacterium BCK34]|nr:LysR family transcriptional regulator [Verrucomicrobiales bacterium BCK34]
MLELRHLQTLTALAETGSMVAASKRLKLTQSALSHQIKSLEDHYGCPFFERKTNPLRWTPVGERLVGLAYDLHRAVNDANREVARLLEGRAGQLRIAVECHSCFDWLMPSMDGFRENWDEVELDLVSGFHPDPVELLTENRSDMVIVSRKKRRAGIDFHPLFSYSMPVILGRKHPLVGKKYLTARDFADEVLITYPIPDERLDLIRQVLGPAGVNPARRTAMLTEAILQLVASGRGISALPAWAIQPFLDRGYVIGRPIGKNGLQCELYAATTATGSQTSYVTDFIKTMREVSFRQLKGIEMLHS